MFYKLSEKQRGKIVDHMNPPGHNHKSVNWIKSLYQDNEGCNFEIGYWITYIGCRPIYKKEQVYFTNKQLDEFNK